MIKIGLDPSLRNWGYIILENNHIKEMGTIHTSSRQIKGSPNVVLKDRARTLWEALTETIDLHMEDTTKVYVELPVGSQSASSRDSYAVCVAIVAMLEDRYEKQFTVVKPSEVKAVTGNKKASKKEVVDWAFTTYPSDHWEQRKGKPLLKNEHCADALAAIVAGSKK